MKQVLITLFFFCCASYINAQVTVISSDAINVPKQTLDSAYLKCSYTLHFLPDVNKPENTQNEEMLLLVGGKISSFYSYVQYYADSLLATMSREQIVESINAQRVNFGKIPYVIFKNYPEGKITTTDKISMTSYKYEEPFEMQKWEIHPETEDILGYTCQKATTSFRGRDYVAWFTTEIPVNNGPWKFAGLPGLILNIADTQNHYVFECSGIETPKEKIAIGIKKENYLTLSKKEFNKVYERYLKDPIGFIQNSNPNVRVTMTNEDGTPARNQTMKIPYNPIELP